jgi:serine/threonine-protein kinase
VDTLNRDLLVAVLAILTDAVPRPELSAALKSWTVDRDQSLAQWLKQVGGLDEERIRALECLATTHLKAHHNDLRLSLYAWKAVGLTQEMLTDVQDESLRTSLTTTIGGDDTLPMGEGFAGDLSAAVVNSAACISEAGRFQLIRPHARGGIGQVWVARDSELQRDVALKEIQPRYAERADHRARFVLEAEITGNLEHPGIVPVYSLGRNAKGQPYYAMRFIQGESLSVAIKRFHAGIRDAGGVSSKRSRWTWGIEFRQLLRRFLDVCDAIDFAHSRGVIHRDLKPANIMLGRYGETLVVDWGLAKLIGKQQGPSDQPDGEFQPSLAGAAVATSDETQQGTTIGTPSYMSPEQARGAIDQLGPSTDVYSLGATLYELLTGKVAYPGEKVKEVLEKVIQGDFPAPRTVERSIPAALEAVCLKAMAHEPEQRFPSVRALAQDLEHWMADEPVTAYPERRLERLGRWLRQHRTWAAAAVAGLVGVSLVATVAAMVIEGARRREALVRKEAEDNFMMAQSAVEKYLTNVSENTLLKIQDSVDFRSLRQELLDTALTYYKTFVSARSNDPNLRRQLANAYFRVGEVTKDIGSRPEAIEAFRSAQAIWESLAAANPQDDELQGHLADCHRAIGEQQRELGDLQGAMTALGRSRATLERLAPSHTDVARYQSGLAECYLEIAVIEGQLQAGDHGLDILEKARAIQEKLIARNPADIKYRTKLAEMTNVLGFVHFKRLEFPAALRSFEEVQESCNSLLAQMTAGPKPVGLLDLLAVSYYNVAMIHVANRDYEKALASLEKSLENRAALTAANPSVMQFWEKLGRAYSEVADVQHKARQDDKAFASIEKSIEILAKLVDAHPGKASHHGALGRSLNVLGYLHDERRDNAKAIPELKKAVDQQQRAIDLSPDTNDYKSDLCNHLDNLGEQYVDLGQAELAAPYYSREIKIRHDLHAAHPGKRDYLLDLVDALLGYGIIQRHSGDSSGAQRTFRDAVTVLQPAADAAAGDEDIRSRLGYALTREAAALADLHQPARAVPLLRRAVEICSAPSGPGADTALLRDRQSEALWELARVLRMSANSPEADQVDAQRVALWRGRPPAELVELALKLTSRAATIGYGKSPKSAPVQSVRDLDLTQAAANLRQAVDQGFRDLRTIQSHPDSALLLSRDDVKSLVKRFE